TSKAVAERLADGVRVRLPALGAKPLCVASVVGVGYLLVVVFLVASFQTALDSSGRFSPEVVINWCMVGILAATGGLVVLGLLTWAVHRAIVRTVIEATPAGLCLSVQGVWRQEHVWAREEILCIQLVTGLNLYTHAGPQSLLTDRGTRSFNDRVEL